MNNSDFSELDDFIKNTNKRNRLQKKKKKKIIIILINIISISCLIGGGFGLKTIYDYRQDLEEAKEIQENLTNFVNETIEAEINELEQENVQQSIIEEETTPVSNNSQPTAPASNNSQTSTTVRRQASQTAYTQLSDTNSDYVGWLKVNNTKVNLPIVQAADNKYYLTHNYDKNYSYVGWVFADYRNSFPALDQNTLLYGHTMQNGLMFSTLSYTLRDSWLNNKDNHIIEFSTTTKSLYWKVFSIYTTPATNDYTQINFTENEFVDFINTVKKKSIRNFDVSLDENDKILTLSTCYLNNKNRLIIHAKLIN